MEGSGTLGIGIWGTNDQEICDSNSIFVDFGFILQLFRCARVPG